MKINKVVIEKFAQEKILEHGLQRGEVENGIFFGKPKFSKDRYGRYVAITNYNKYITVVFEYVNFNAYVITAYPSSEWQVKKYKRK